MSDDTALLLASLDASGVHVCSARHENTAVAMAEGYAAATGKLGVAVIGRGPALTNAFHGVVYASRTGAPVLVLAGDAPQSAGDVDGVGPDAKGFNAGPVLDAAGLAT